jgi:DUF1680 family protein
LIEGALAHSNHYHNDLLLEPILKYVDLLCRTFGPGTDQRHGYAGHPEIELALLRLYEKTGEPKHLALARYFIEERGNPTGQDGRHYYDVEFETRGDKEHERPVYLPNNRSYWYAGWAEIDDLQLILDFLGTSKHMSQLSTNRP